MNSSPECISCIFNQALRVAKELDLDEKKTKEILDLSAKMLPQMSLALTPPQNATPMYQNIAKHLGLSDLYKDVKLKSIKKAKELEPYAREILNNSTDKFLTATKIAVVGNVIDLASVVSFDLNKELEKVTKSSFSIDDSKKLHEKLKKSKNIVYLADNAGENVFDLIFIEFLKNEFKELKIYYFVRSAPIINDLTPDDLKDDELSKFATIVDSGVKTPGIIYEDLNKEAKKLFDNADLIISKGMGNYECLSNSKTFPIFFLLKIKCAVVANSLNEQIGAIICKKI